MLPSGGFCRVFASTRASSAGVRTVGGWPRYFARKPGQPLGFEPLFPAADVIRVAPDGRRDRGERLAVGQHQNHLRAARIFRADLAAAHAPFQFGRSSVVNVSAIWRRSLPLVIQWLQSTRSFPGMASMSSEHHDRANPLRAGIAGAEPARLDQRLQTVLESITEPFYHLDDAWRFVFVNQPALDYLGTSREALLGRVLWEAFPKTEDSLFGERFKWAVSEGKTAEFETVSPLTGKLVDVRAYPSAEGLTVSFRDVSARRYAEARDRFLVELDDATRTLTDPDDITRTAARLLGTHLGVNRCAYADVEAGSDTFDVTGDFCNGVSSSVGRYALAAFGGEFERATRAGTPLVVDDAETDSRTAAVRDGTGRPGSGRSFRCLS